jgi:hypothetical protein
MTHVQTSPYYPKSNGKTERWHKTRKQTAIRSQTPLTLGDALRVVVRFDDEYNSERLYSAIGYVILKAELDGREQQIFDMRDDRLEAARAGRILLLQNVRTIGAVPLPVPAVAAFLSLLRLFLNMLTPDARRPYSRPANTVVTCYKSQELAQ